MLKKVRWKWNLAIPERSQPGGRRKPGRKGGAGKGKEW